MNFGLSHNISALGDTQSTGTAPDAQQGAQQPGVQYYHPGVMNIVQPMIAVPGTYPYHVAPQMVVQQQPQHYNSYFAPMPQQHHQAMLQHTAYNPNVYVAIPSQTAQQQLMMSDDRRNGRYDGGVPAGGYSPNTSMMFSYAQLAAMQAPQHQVVSSPSCQLPLVLLQPPSYNSGNFFSQSRRRSTENSLSDVQTPIMTPSAITHAASFSTSRGLQQQPPPISPNSVDRTVETQLDNSMRSLTLNNSITAQSPHDMPIMAVNHDPATALGIRDASNTMLPAGHTSRPILSQTSGTLIDKRQLIVNYLSAEINTNALLDLFRQFGELDGGKVVYNANNQSKGYGFVYFKEAAAAAKAIEALDQKEFCGKKLRVQVSKNPITIFSGGGV